MCNHHHNLESEHMTFKVEQIAYVSEDTPELIGNQRLLSWCAKQEWGRRAAKLLGKWWRWTTERDHSISNITSKKCNNTVAINCLVYISGGITMTTAWLYSIPKDTAYNVMCCKMQNRQDKAHSVLNYHHIHVILGWPTGSWRTLLRGIIDLIFLGLRFQLLLVTDL